MNGWRQSGLSMSPCGGRCLDMPASCNSFMRIFVVPTEKSISDQTELFRVTARRDILFLLGNQLRNRFADRHQLNRPAILAAIPRVQGNCQRVVNRCGQVLRRNGVIDDELA